MFLSFQNPTHSLHVPSRNARAYIGWNETRKLPSRSPVAGLGIFCGGDYIPYMCCITEWWVHPSSSTSCGCDLAKINCGLVKMGWCVRVNPTEICIVLCHINPNGPHEGL